MKEALLLRDTEKINSTLKTMERNLSVLNENHQTIKEMGYPSIVSIYASDFELWRKELKLEIIKNTEGCNIEKMYDIFEYIENLELEQFVEGTGEWFIDWVFFNSERDTFQLKQDYEKTINEEYTFIVLEENLRENLKKAGLLIEIK
jgi:hypothetical protein